MDNKNFFSKKKKIYHFFYIYIIYNVKLFYIYIIYI